MSYDVTTFRPRPSLGWLWLVLIALLILVSTVGVSLLTLAEMPWGIHLMNGIIGVGIGIPLLVLAAWVPSMRYELNTSSLTLLYGPLLRYRIDLGQIQNIRRRNLSVSLWSSMRLPGLALFTVPYADEGKVKMCATAASRGVLLIETLDSKYGLTPADEEAFVRELQARMKG